MDIYRVAGTEVFVVRGPRGKFDVPAVRAFVADLAPRRREIVVDAGALDASPRGRTTSAADRPKKRRGGTSREGAHDSDQEPVTGEGTGRGAA